MLACIKRSMKGLTPRLTGAGARSAEGTNTGHENAEGMASVGVRLTDQLGQAWKNAPLLIEKSLIVGFHKVLEKLYGLL